MIGERLKHAFCGNDAWILSYRDECFDQIGLKASVKVPLFNGSLECQFRKYQIFDGKYKTFRSENSDKEFKPKREGNEVRPRKRAERVEYKGDRKPAFRTDRKEMIRKTSLVRTVPHAHLPMTDVQSRHRHLVTCIVAAQMKKILRTNN